MLVTVLYNAALHLQFLNILRESFAQHIVNAIRSEGRSCHTVNLRIGVFNFLYHADGKLSVIGKNLLSAKTLLPFLRILYLRAQTSSLALMIEIGAIDGIEVFINGYKAADTTP